MNKVFKTVYDRLSKNNDLFSGITGKIKDAESDIRAANADADKAMKKGDFDAYKKASEELEDARLAKEMYQRRLDELKSTSVLSEEERKEMDAAIRGYIQDLKKKSIEKAKAAVAPLQDDFKQMNSEIEQANEALRVLNSEMCHTDYVPIVAAAYFSNIRNTLAILNVDSDSDYL